MGKLIKEFKEFAVKGNAVDMAVAVVIGAAFTAIVTSLVNDLIMPCIGVLIGGADFANLAITLKAGSPEVLDAAGNVVAPAVEPVLFSYGKFINAVISFIIVAFTIFMVVRGINKLKRKKAEVAEAPAEPSDEVKLLTEIRDLMKKSEKNREN